jgi:hypothetical protein
MSERRTLTSTARHGEDPFVINLEQRPGSLLGQLELGLGVGFLRALRAPADEVSELVLDCVDRDPRLDLNLDERDDYYALLLLAVGVDAVAVERLVSAHEPTGDDPEDHSTLPLEVLLRMGVRGSRGAQHALGRYVANGVDLTFLLDVLQGDGEQTSKIPAWRSTMEALGPVLCERFPSRAELLSALEEMGDSFLIGSDTPPWSLWAAQSPMIADALRDYDAATPPIQARGPVPALASFRTEQLLTLDRPAQWHEVFTLLSERTSDSDVRLLLTAVRDGSFAMRGPALLALAHQRRPEALEIAAELCDETGGGGWRGWMIRALLFLPYDQTRSLAREWFESDQVVRRRAAAKILERHADVEEIPAIREYLCRDLIDSDTSDLYIVCDLAGALGRHPDHGPYPELTSIFYGIPYSYGRHHIARAMAETDPAFARTQAVECLWDCQAVTRDEIGAKHVDIRDPAAHARLRVMAADPAEDEDTQLAAQSRLGDQ